MDSQELIVDIMFNNYTDCEILVREFNFKWIDPRFGKFFHFHDSVWKLDRNNITRTLHSDSRHYEMRFYITRNENYYISRICVIQGFLVAMSLFINICDSDTSFIEKLNVIISLVLATVAFLFTIQDDIPKLSYYTLIDKYLFSSFGFFFFYALLLAWNRHKNINKDLFDGYISVISILSFISYHLVFAVLVRKGKSESIEWLNEKLNSTKIKSRLHDGNTFSENQYREKTN
jgi:hypothetical protein